MEGITELKSDNYFDFVTTWLVFNTISYNKTFLG